MKILIYTNYYPAPSGFRTRTDTLIIHYFAKELQQQGHDVRVVFISSLSLHYLIKNRFRDIMPTEDDYEYEGVNVHLIRYMTIVPRQSYPHKYQAACINRMLKSFKKRTGFRPDKVFVHFPAVYTGISEILADGVPVMGDFHHVDMYMIEKRYLSRHYNESVKNYIRQIPLWGYRNKRVEAALKEVDHRHPLLRTYSGIDDSVLAPGDFIEQKVKRKPEERMHILYTGQLIPRKNVDILIQAVRQLSFEWDLTIVGDGEDREKLEALAAGTEDITFTGILPREEVFARMKAADVFIMLSSPETYGLVYLEAMAQGCITVAGRGEGFDGIIEEGVNGFIEEVRSVDAAVRVLERIYAMSSEERADMIRKSYEFAESMTEDKIVKRLLEVNVLKP